MERETNYTPSEEGEAKVVERREKEQGLKKSYERINPNQSDYIIQGEYNGKKVFVAEHFRDHTDDDGKPTGFIEAQGYSGAIDDVPLSSKGAERLFDFMRSLALKDETTYLDEAKTHRRDLEAKLLRAQEAENELLDELLS